MTEFEGLLGSNIKTTPQGMHHLPDYRGLSLSEMISSGAYKLVTGVERLVHRR